MFHILFLRLLIVISSVKAVGMEKKMEQGNQWGFYSGSAFNASLRFFFFIPCKKLVITLSTTAKN